MDSTLYLCKIEHTSSGDNILLFDEEPLRYFKKMNKKLKEWHNDDDCDEDEDEKPIKELNLISYEKKEFNYICVRIVISSLAKKFRSVVENRNYGYNRIEYITNVNCYLISDLFNIADGMIHEDSEMMYVKEFFNNNDDIVVLKRIKGENIFVYFLYSKNVKYEDVIKQIKKDFKVYDEKDRFYVLDDDKEYYRQYYKHQGIERHISLNKIKKEKFLNIRNFTMKKYDTIWLENKLGIKLNKERFDDPKYAIELKGKASKKIIHTDYVDFTRVGRQEENFEFNGDEGILLTEDEIKEIKDYKTMMKKKHNIDLHDDNVTDNYVCDYEKSDLDNVNEVLHIVLKNDKILFTEIIKENEVPKWKNISYELNIDGKEIKVKDFKK